MKNALGWRTGILGRLLGIHSPVGHALEVCWCKGTKREISPVNFYTATQARLDSKAFYNFFEHAPYMNEFGYCNDPFCDIEEGHKHGGLCHMDCSCKRRASNAGIQ